MATTTFRLESADPSVVEVDMEESEHEEDDQSKPLHCAMGDSVGVDHVLVYEEEEEKDEQSKQTADNFAKHEKRIREEPQRRWVNCRSSYLLFCDT